MSVFIKSENRALKRLLLNPYLIPFCISFALVAFFIFPLPDLLNGGGDATSIWQTILTFRNEKITSSYVLYKGFLSVYPYIWLYELSNFLGLDPFYFIKIYHALLFSFVAAIGTPFIISKILSIEIKLYKNIIYVFILFYITRFTNIFHILMVDLPTWAFFVAAISTAYLPLKLDSIKSALILLTAGILTGLTLCSSGQYALAGYLIITYVGVSVLKQNAISVKNKNVTAFLFFLVFIFGVALPKSYDIHFEKTIVQPMRDRGDWLPTGKQWLASGVTTTIMRYKPFSYPSESNRGLAILKKTEGENFSSRVSLIRQGGGSYSASEYLNIVKSNALDFSVMWATKMFLALSFDDGKSRISHLLISYTSLFVCFCLILLKCKRIGDILTSNTLIVLSMIAVIAAPVFLHIEMRYAVSLMGFIIGFAIHQEKLANRFRSFPNFWNISNINFQYKYICNLPLPWLTIFYGLFLVFGFTLYGSLLEISGSDPGVILFKW